MNKTFKTVWNQARRCLVAVNETVRSKSQSQGSTTTTVQSAVKDKHFLLTGLFSAILLSVSHSALAGNVPADCVSMGGSVNESGVCVFGEETQLGETGLQEDIILTDGDLLIRGSKAEARKSGILIGTNNGATVTLQNNGTGVLTIQGGDKVYSYGIETAATGAGSKFWIRNSSSGDLNILGSATTRTVDGILNGAVDGATLVIDNETDGNLLIQGGNQGKTSYGIYHGATGEGSTIEINNKGDGNLTISGGNFESAIGIYELSTNGGTGTITNSGNGTLTIKAGGADQTYGIGVLKGGDIIQNTGNGKLVFETSTMPFFGEAQKVDGKAPKVINSGSGVIEFIGKVNKFIGTPKLDGIFFKSLKDFTDSVYDIPALNILNISDGKILFTDLSGCQMDISVENSGTGEIIFSSNNTKQLNIDGNNGKIINGENAKFTVEKGKLYSRYLENDGIFTVKSSATFGARILNNGTFIAEDKSSIYGSFDHSDTFINKGLLVIADTANFDRPYFTNTSTGVITTPAETFFNKECLTFADVPYIKYINGTSEETLYSTPTYEDIKWTLKDDWRNHAKFEDGGSITFTNVWENTVNEADIVKLFQQVWGNGTILSFQKGDEPQPTPFKVTTKVINKIRSSYNYPILHKTDFESDQKDLVIGDSLSISGSVGFKTISNANTIAVKNTQDLWLLGNGSNATEAVINLDNNSDLFLGADNALITDTQGGLVNSIQGTGRITVNKGVFETNSLIGETLQIKTPASFTVADLQGNTQVSNSGLLEIGSLNLSDSGHLINNATGTVKLYYNDVFSQDDGEGSATLNTIGIAETTETTVKPVTTSYFAEGELGGKLLDFIKTNTTWKSGGKLIVKLGDQEVSQAVWNGAVKDFQKTFGTGTTLSYEGTLADKGTGALAGGVFSVSALNILYANEPDLRGVIYVDRALDGEGSDVRVSDSTDALHNSTGFTSVVNAPKVWIEAGKELALIGEKSDDATIRKTVAPNINVTGIDAKLTLGSLGLKNAAQYRTELPELALADNAHFNAVAGDHLITSFESNNASSSIGNGVTLRIQTPVFHEESVFDNYGSTTFGTLNGNYLTHINNYGDMVVEGATRLSGWMNNSKNLQFKDNATFVGTLQNNEDGKIYAKTVNVIGSLVNKGYMEAKDDSTVNGRIENPGTIILYTVDINKGDTELNGTIHNTYKLVGTGVANVNGYLKNAPGAVAIFNDEDSVVNINEGGAVTNEGTLIAKAGEIYGSLQTSDLAVLDKVKGSATSTVVAKGTLMTKTFSTDGMVLTAKDTEVVIGGDASRTKYLLAHLDIAKKILDAGGDLPQSVKDALKNQGIAVVSVEEVPVEEAPVRVVRKAARRAVASPVAEESAVDETTAPDTETKAVAQAEVTEEAAKEEAKAAAKSEVKEADEKTVIAREISAPTTSVMTRLVRSVQGAVTSMSIASVTQDTGFLEDKALNKGDGLWVDVGTNRIEFNGYKGNRSGLFFGGQANVNDNVLVGAAIRYTDGNIKGNGLDKQDWSSYGAGVYASYTKDGWFALGTGTYQSNRAKKGGRVEANTFALSVKGGKTIEAKNFTVTPYVGYRMVHVDTDYADKATVHQIPIGVKIQGNTRAGDWKFAPSVDVAIVPQLGDRKVNLKGTHGLQSAIASRYATDAKVGFSAAKGNFGAGLYYTGSAGDKGLRSHSVQARVNYAF